jgi:hypothetical protein
VRAAFVILCQHSGQELQTVRDAITFFNAPHQEYLQRYFIQLVQNEQDGKSICTDIKKRELSESDFVDYLHQLDLVKANRACRVEFDQLIRQKLEECEDNWPRLKRRLEAIQRQFIQNPYVRS